MDVNHTYFHLLFGERDWASLLPKETPTSKPDVVWGEDRGCVSLRPLLFRFSQPKGETAFGLADRRGAGQDRYGNWYRIDTTGAGIDFLPLGGRQAQHFWPPEAAGATQPDKAGGVFLPADPPPPPAPVPLQGLAVTTHHYLVVGVLKPAGLLIFDLHAGGPPIRVEWPVQIPFHPFELAPRPGGGVWILDAAPEKLGTVAARYWALDRYFRVEGCEQAEVPLPPPPDRLFQPKRGAPREKPGRTFPAGLSLEMASPLDERDPIALEALPDDTVLVLSIDPEDGASWVARYDFSRRRGEAVALREKMKEIEGVPLAWQAYDMAFVPASGLSDRLTGTLYVVGTEGNQAYAFRLEATLDRLSLELLGQYYPLRRFGGKSLVACGPTVYYGHGDRWLPLAARPRPRYLTEGVLETAPDRPFDGKVSDCVWHRLFLDACIPPGAEVRVESRAANDRALLTGEAWQQEPGLYRRAAGAEIPYYQPFSTEEAQRAGTGTWELLFQRARGRYLQLRLALVGTGRSTPRLYALRAYYPRFSYLREYLPDVYQQDATSASFLDRFLANSEGLFTELEGRIAEVQTLFDTRTLDPAYLDWLGGWLGLVFDPRYDARRRRLFIDHAIELYEQSGTPAGLVRTLRLAIDPCPDDAIFEENAVACDVGDLRRCVPDTGVVQHSVRIVEQFLTRRLPGVHFGDPTDPDPLFPAAPAGPWTPAQGAEVLHRRYRAFLEHRYGTPEALSKAWNEPYPSSDRVLLSPVLPQNTAAREDWRTFIQRTFGPAYAEIDPGTPEGRQDANRYRTLLACRYGEIEHLNRAYVRSFEDFCDVELPGERDFPATGPRLYDWIRFITRALPIHRRRHRFSVLIPITPGEDPAAQAERLALAERVVALEKPAHTFFEIKPYWALFQVGLARLGLDTRLDAGSRYVALLLGQTTLAEGYLAAPHPWDVPDRIVEGRDAPGGMVL